MCCGVTRRIFHLGITATSKNRECVYPDDTAAANTAASGPVAVAVYQVENVCCCLPDWAWRESFQRNSMRPIARGRRKFGSRSKTRRRLRQLGRLTGRSSSAELTGKILCCITISKPPADDSAIALAPELTA